jgi:predicted ABC-type ATPase
LLAGPNGAGKSTLVEHVILPTAPRLEFVNADEIAREAAEAGHALDAYEAARQAASRRDELLATQRSFITETVFSHPSKLELIDAALEAGYVVVLHVVMVPLGVSLKRVRERASLGGHDVPPEKIRERYERLWDLVAAAVRRATEAHVYDNSQIRRPLREVAAFDFGRPVGDITWPSWTPRPLRALTR